MTGSGGRLAACLAAVTVLLALTVVNPLRAYACECAGISTARALGQADAVFLGTVVAAERAGGRSERRTDLRFSVTKVYKGTVYADQLLTSPPDAAACGLRPDVGSSWLIFAVDSYEGRGDESVYRLRTTTCGGNLPISTAPADLGRPRDPLPGPSDREEASITTDLTIRRVLAIGGVGLVGLATLAGVALIVIWRPRNS